MKRARSNHGFSMVEVVMALGIVSFAFVSILSILPLGLSETRNAVAGTEASCVLAAIAADIKAASGTANQTARYKISLPDETSVGAGSQTTIYTGETGSNRDSAGLLLGGPANAKYKAEISFRPRPPSQKTSIPVQITITWPAAATNANASSLGAVIYVNR